MHNLQNLNLDIPRGKLIAICGVSGSGKTSLALDTLYAEGQRRYIESFSAYTRQFLERIDKPDCDRIEGLPPAIAVMRASAVRGNRSTVGTASESADYLRLIFAKIAHLHCFSCGKRIMSHSPQSVARMVSEMPDSAKVMMAFEAQWDGIAERASVLSDLQSSGFVRLVCNHKLLHLGEQERSSLADDLPPSGTVWAIVDRIKGGDSSQRVTESLETCFHFGHGTIRIYFQTTCETRDRLQADWHSVVNEWDVDGKLWYQLDLSCNQRCHECDLDFPEPHPQLFNFNSPLGACPLCEGFGDTMDLDMTLIVPDDRKTIRDGAILPWTTPSYSHNLDELLDVAEQLRIPVDKPFRQLTAKQREVIIDGDERFGFGGISGFFQQLERKKYKMHVRVFLSRWRSYNRCHQCDGKRLGPKALAYRIEGLDFAQLCQLSIDRLMQFWSELLLEDHHKEIVKVPLSQLMHRLNYLRAVGLGYLTLDRTLRTLSAGEIQRSILTTALSGSLVNMLYVLDEPSVGLHPADVERLATAITELADRGNTVVIVEHDEALLQRANWCIEIGPGAGSAGGQVAFAGEPIEFIQPGASLTGEYLSNRRNIPIPPQRREPHRGSIRLTRCTGNNLKEIDAEFPLGLFCVVTGVSGSGKSSLVQDTLYPALMNRFASQHLKCLPFDSVLGCGQIDDCILVDQSPIGRSPRSNPVTYVKAFDEIRNLFASTPDAKARNFTSSHFSFNSDFGRCPSCQGDGSLQIDMQFLADITISCPGCHGQRYKEEILRVRYRDMSIADVLNLTVRDALSIFRGAPKIQAKLRVLVDVGLDYLQLGQSALTLSSGEAQRLKLAAFLASASRKRTLFLMDEPTSGLHMQDIIQLLDCFDALIAAGHSLVVIEHNLHLIAAADHVIDLGPGPSEQGGQIVICGTPEEVSNCEHSATGKYLAHHFSRYAV